MPLETFVEAGYAIASVDYRLSTVAPFPAQVHDVKAAIRFLRASQLQYGYDAKQIANLGNSAGGHLAALVGVTNGHAELEGKVGECLEESSSVQAVVSYYGMSNLTTILAQSTSISGLWSHKPCAIASSTALPTGKIPTRLVTISCCPRCACRSHVEVSRWSKCVPALRNRVTNKPVIRGRRER